MTKYEIKALAIRCGFKLREQPDGTLDLNPYVYDFANRLIAAEREACAAIADSYEDHTESDIADDIAYDIRKRGRK